MHGLSSDGSQSALLKINSRIPKLPKFPKIPKFPKFPKWPDLVDRIFQTIRADFLEILESPRQDFPKHKGGLFGNFGNFGMLEIRKVRGENFGNCGIEFGRAGRHPSDDRPCTTTQLRGHGLSTRGATILYIYIIYIHLCVSVCVQVD